MSKIVVETRAAASCVNIGLRISNRMVGLRGGPANPKPNLETGVTFELYNGGKVEMRGELDTDSRVVQQLEKLLHQAENHWKVSRVSYAHRLNLRERTGRSRCRRGE